MRKTKEFKNIPLELIAPDFEDKVTDLILELDFLRKKVLRGTTHPFTFFQLKKIFHILESVFSAQIEGNQTTVEQFIEEKVFEKNTKDEKIKEIDNMEEALDFIDNTVGEHPINRMFISELHKKVVNGLSPSQEGDKTPGKYRTTNVDIKNSLHLPPGVSLVNGYMEQLVEFINKNEAPKYDLLKTAISHHRFVWIHPFTNGNGRTVRLLTYAMLVKQGFNVHKERILNPTAVFCNDRNQYYHYLSEADKGTNKGRKRWCEYVLTGLKEEIEKIDNLLDYSFLSKQILLPAINFSLEMQHITPQEAKILKLTVDLQEVKAGDIAKLFPKQIPASISRTIKKLKGKKMLEPARDRQRTYLLSFNNNYLLRGIIKKLRENGFVPDVGNKR